MRGSRRDSGSSPGWHETEPPRDLDRRARRMGRARALHRCGRRRAGHPPAGELRSPAERGLRAPGRASARRSRSHQGDVGRRPPRDDLAGSSTGAEAITSSTDQRGVVSCAWIARGPARTCDGRRGRVRPRKVRSDNRRLRFAAFSRTGRRRERRSGFPHDRRAAVTKSADMRDVRVTPSSLPSAAWQRQRPHGARRHSSRS
jgi:hypothetical protein